jgi:hypothetical protein
MVDIPEKFNFYAKQNTFLFLTLLAIWERSPKL